MNDAHRETVNRPADTGRRPWRRLVGPLAVVVLFAGGVFFVGELLAAAKYASIGGLGFAEGVGLWNQPLKPGTSYLWWEVGIKLRIDRAVSGFILFAIIGFAAWLGYRFAGPSREA